MNRYTPPRPAPPLPSTVSEDIRKICSLIKGDGFQAEGYLYDIVANKRNG